MRTETGQAGAKDSPLRGEEIEVLNALGVGLTLARTSFGWAFVNSDGPSKDSTVPLPAVRVLLARGYIQRFGASRLLLSASGGDYLRRRAEKMLQEALTWPRSPGSLL